MQVLQQTNQNIPILTQVNQRMPTVPQTVPQRVLRNQGMFVFAQLIVNMVYEIKMKNMMSMVQKHGLVYVCPQQMVYTMYFGRLLDYPHHRLLRPLGILCLLYNPVGILVIPQLLYSLLLLLYHALHQPQRLLMRHLLPNSESFHDLNGKLPLLLDSMPDTVGQRL